MVRASTTALLLALPGCDQPADLPASDKVPVERRAENVPDPGEALAREAGRSLLGRRAPDFRLRTIDGANVDRDGPDGRRPLYLKFWATWCIPCRQQMPHLRRIHDRHGDRLVVVAVNTGFNDTREAVETYRRAQRLRMPIVIDDGSLAEALDLRVTPQHVLIGADGRIRHVGHLADAALDRAIADAIDDRGTEAAPAAAIAPTAVLRVGDPVPSAAVRMLDGGDFAFGSGRRGQPATALVFMAPWCETYLAGSRPAIASACRQVREEAESLARRGGVRWIAISSRLWSTEQDLATYRDERDVRIPLAIDRTGRLFRMFGVARTPTIILLDENGRIERRLEPDDPNLRDALTAMTQGRRRTGGS